jgi:hypothetical protein
MHMHTGFVVAAYMSAHTARSDLVSRPVKSTRSLRMAVQHSRECRKRRGADFASLWMAIYFSEIVDCHAFALGIATRCRDNDEM